MIYSNWLVFPPLLSLVISSWLILNSDKRSLLRSNLYLSIFLAGIVGLNLIEFLSYAAIFPPSIILMKLYYVFMIVTLASILSLIIKICSIELITKHYLHAQFFLGFITVIFTIGILFTDYFIAGYTLTTYSITRTPGELYFLIKSLFLVLSLPILILLAVGSFRNNFDDNVKRSRVILASFSPLLISLLAVLGLMELGIQINASIVLPIGSTILLLVIINTESKQDLFKFLIRTPYTQENMSYKKITAEIEGFLASTRCGEKSSLKDLTSSLEQHIVNLVVESSNGSQVKAAELLNTSTSSICRKKRA